VSRQEAGAKTDGSEDEHSYRKSERVARFQAKKHGSGGFASGERESDADSQADGDKDSHFAEDETDHSGALRSERHADSDFVRPLGNRVGNHAVQPYCGEQQREATEKAAEGGHLLILKQRIVNLGAKQLELDVDLGIHADDFVLDGIQQTGETASRANQEAKPGEELRFVGLRPGEVHDRHHGLVHSL